MSTDTEQVFSKPDAAQSARVNALDTATAALVAVIEQWPDDVHDQVMREIVRDLAYELVIDDPYDQDDDTDWPSLLRDIRADLKASDIEHALLLIHYELGDC
ncbi:hypothetical protein [Mesorhizobium sp. M00.F.Ca.ET.216.01.1.1]|uniref:hypothetical protein n=1 Tax=Mesorhizobium sp. M00.F.Ca.ET.216.01.1.1 TaxID=2500528 RepID=UPI000FD91871|nr:hypothetical protein [Mesorhizobium sp. M00.F.Ca.ET.216.01.1.1]TGQ41179.1 hypothetical protein EN859_012565 [Mesorhizobium sp. M00.F.Ca.ET.216.01.1.1]